MLLLLFVAAHWALNNITNQCLTHHSIQLSLGQTAGIKYLRSLVEIPQIMLFCKTLMKHQQFRDPTNGCLIIWSERGSWYHKRCTLITWWRAALSGSLGWRLESSPWQTPSRYWLPATLAVFKRAVAAIQKVAWRDIAERVHQGRGEKMMMRRIKVAGGMWWVDWPSRGG